MLPQAQVKPKAKRKRRTRDNDREEEEEDVGHSDSAAPQVKRSLRKKAKIDYTIDLGDEEVRLPQPVKRGTRKRGIDREGGEVKQATRGRGRRPSKKVSSDDGNDNQRRSMSSSLSPPPSDTAK